MAEQLSFDFPPPPVRPIGPVVLIGVGGSLAAKVTKIRPPDPPDAGIAEMTWGAMLRELIDILREAWMALPAVLLSVRRHA